MKKKLLCLAFLLAVGALAAQAPALDGGDPPPNCAPGVPNCPPGN